MSLLPLLLLLLPSALMGTVVNTPDNPMGEFEPICLADEPSLWDETRIEKKWYTIDLDKEAHERWAEVAGDYKPQMLAAIDVVRTVVESVGGEDAWTAAVKLMAGAPDKLTEPYKSEIHAMADLTGIAIEEITLLNLFYEVSAACTSLVAIDHDGKVFHGRNLDFGIYFIWNTEEHQWELTRKLRDLVAQYEFVKGGKLLFKGVTFAGHFGLLTAVRPGAFSVSINTRFGSSLETLTKFFLHGLDDDQQFVLYVLRDMMTNCANFDEAQKYIETEQLLAPGYFTIGHPKGGTIFTRSITQADHEAVIDVKQQPNGWYVLQTNYDWDKDDKYLDQRTVPGNKCMQKLGRKRVSKEGIFQVLSSKTNLNKGTVYTSIMEIDSGALYTFKQDCKDPCWYS